MDAITIAIRHSPRKAFASKILRHPVASHTDASYDVPHPVPDLSPRHMTPLLQKEVTRLSYCPAWQQQAWIHAGRDPVYWSPAPYSYYYFYDPPQSVPNPTAINHPIQ